jgi:hypothetical protein
MVCPRLGGRAARTTTDRPPRKMLSWLGSTASRTAGRLGGAIVKEKEEASSVAGCWPSGNGSGMG